MSTSAYSYSGWMLSAWLAGIVHGVVVQITAAAGLVEGSQAEGFSEPRRLIDREGDVDRGRLLVGILDLGLGQRRTAVEAPVYRLQALEDVASLDHFASARISLASLAKFIVLYGLSQSPGRRGGRNP